MGTAAAGFQGPRMSQPCPPTQGHWCSTHFLNSFLSWTAQPGPGHGAGGAPLAWDLLFFGAVDDQKARYELGGLQVPIPKTHQESLGGHGFRAHSYTCINHLSLFGKLLHDASIH